MGDEIAGFGTVFMMTEDGGYEPVGDVANWSVELHGEDLYRDSPDLDPLEGTTEFVRERAVVPRPAWLFMCAFDSGDKTFRNYVKAVKRSKRNSGAKR